MQFKILEIRVPKGDTVPISVILCIENDQVVVFMFDWTDEGALIIKNGTF